MNQTGVNSISTALPGFKLVFGYEYGGELLISATWNALWTAMTSLGMLVGKCCMSTLTDYMSDALQVVLLVGRFLIGLGGKWA